MEEKRISISEKDLYCIARLLQSCLYATNRFIGCRYCKYNCDTETELSPNYDKVICRLQQVTGVDFDYKDIVPERFKRDKSPCGDRDF